MYRTCSTMRGGARLLREMRRRGKSSSRWGEEGDGGGCCSADGGNTDDLTRVTERAEVIASERSNRESGALILRLYLAPTHHCRAL